MTPEIQAKLDSMQAEIDALKSQNTIPRSVEGAFRERLRLSSVTNFLTSAKAGTSEAQIVIESGASTYNVQGLPDGYLQTVISGVTYYTPYYL